MSNDRLNNRHQRNIYKRIIVKGMLILDTPTCLGSGNSDSLTDLALLRDSVDEDKALLTGASIAGALRNYLHEYDPSLGLATLLFGANRQDDQGDQSAKYDFELLSAGTQFPLFFELLIEKKYQDLQKQSEYENNLKQGLAIALSGFEKGEIAIGMKKRRGFGRCKVENWQVWEFDLRNSQHRLAWLTFDRELGNEYTVAETLKEGKIEHIFGAVSGDQRDRFTISAKFSLVGSMLIRSGQSLQKDKDGKYSKSPDAVHLKSNRSDKSESIISGTSLAGVLRHRAVRIVKTLNPNIVIPEGKDRQPEIIEKIFGFVAEDEKRKDVLKAQASRLIVEEKVIEKPTELVQPRIAINRFTGGAMHGALFDAQPVFSGEVELKLELWNPKDKDNEYKIGLLLLLLKDLWTGDLPIGSESSIGRGRLQGLHADITYQGNTWTIQGKDSLTITPDIAKETLESYVEKFIKEVEVKS